MIGTNEVKSEPLLVFLLNELKEKYRPRLVVLCTIRLNQNAGSPIAYFLNGNVTRWNMMVKSLIAENLNELRLMNVENVVRMVDHRALMSRSPRLQHPLKKTLGLWP